MLFAADLSLPIDSWVQYGCFGLLAAIVAWALLKGVPATLDSFKEALKIVTDSFRDEQAHCREERVTRDAWIAREFELNRASRDKFNDAVEALKRFPLTEGE